ncbi:MAG TPA: AmmeMemoRadiSam system protein B [Syntrophorhabdaceae bacterium]|nr:AmmeMemoRadiSam system protein B [Syntrophorhabdaceae bacterium]
MDKTGFIREPAVSGTFYPDEPVRLRRQIEGYLEDATVPAIDVEVLGLVSPHAGYVYSGPVAAYGFKMIAGRQYDTAVIIAPSHRVYFEGVALWDRGGFRTSLGTVDIDEEAAKEVLRPGGIIQANMRPHQEEHSLEVQLPFLQSVLGDFRLIPLIMGNQDASTCANLAQSLFVVMQKSKKKFLIVGSTDLSHYYPYAQAKKLDTIIVSRLDAFDIMGMIEDISGNRAEACGAGPMVTTMMLCEKLGADRGMSLKYANSGDTSGDKSGVVGYVSAVFYREGQEEVA